MPKARTIAFLVAAATTSLFDHNDSALAQAQPCRSREYAHNASNGRLHPRFDRGSTSLKARNGVGVRADGKIIFAISHGEVSFDAFARLFRDGLNCPNALFLDGGSASSLYAPSLNRLGNILSLGPMLAVYERNRGASRR